MIRRNILKILKNNDVEIEDIIHDVFIKIIRNVQLLSSFDDGVLISYISYISKNTAINFIRRRDIETKLLFYTEDDYIADSVIDDTTTPEELILLKEDFETLRRVLDKMPERCRLILQYKYYCDMADADIAAIFEIKPGTIREYLSRAKKMAYKIYKEDKYAQHKS